MSDRVANRWKRCALALLLAAGAELPAHAALTPEEQRVLAGIDPARALEDMKRLSHSADGIAQGVGEGSVVSGSEEEHALAQQIEQRFRAMGINVRIEEFPVRAYRYTPPRLEVNGKLVAAISLHAAGAVSGRRDGVSFAHGNERGGTRLRAALVDAGDGFAADYARLGDVRGKAVLVRRDLRDWPPAQITEAAQHGATAVLFFDHPSSADRVDALRQDSMWGHEQLPAVAISLGSGRALRKKLTAGPVEIMLESSVEIHDARSRNVLGIIEGSEYPEQWVAVSGHYDRWFRGGLDNVSGTATVLEMARVFTSAGIRPRRSMLFLAVGSEEAGLEDFERDWLAGSHAFLLTHPEVFRQAALVANVDGIGWPGKETHLGATPDILGAQRGVLEDLGLGSEIGLRPTTSSAIDAWNYGVLGGAATTHLFSLDEPYFAIYHTQEDVVLPERFTVLARDLRLLALGLARAASAPRWTPALSALADTVREGFAADAKRLPGVAFDDLDAALAEFRATSVAIESGSAGPNGADADRLLMATRHALVPWLYMADGEYTLAVRSTEYANRVAALDAALGALRGGDRDAARKALDAFPEGRRCGQMSAAGYAFERNFWAGEGGWASRYAHRAPPPLPAFEAACRALQSSGPAEPIAAGLEAARTEALQAASASVALVTAKLRAASATLQSAGTPAAAPR
jgi:Peptidase family M28/PA domain